MRAAAAIFLCLCLPLTALADASVVQRWVPLVSNARWIATGTVLRTTDDGFVAALSDGLKGVPPCEQFVPVRIRPGTSGVAVVLFGYAEGAPGFRMRGDFDPPDWVSRARFVIRSLLQLEETTSPERRLEILRQMAATGDGEALFAAKDFIRAYPGLGPWHDLIPALIQTAKTTASPWAAENSVEIMIPIATAGDLPLLIGLLEREDAGFRAKILARLDALARPRPPHSNPPANATESAALIKERRAWYSAHKDSLRLLGRQQQSSNKSTGNSPLH